MQCGECGYAHATQLKKSKHGGYSLVVGKKLSAVVVNWLPSPGGTRRRIAKPQLNNELTGDNYEGFCPSTYREPGDPPELVRGETTPAVLLAGAERKP
ncbi:hypothetical protein DPZ10_12295 [Klebsiella pneumoniae]|nr:hypothetical protein BK817_27045 [Raoultella ornithinolytica]EIW8771762.1 hypothetical protein [Klebsiella pneumoniae]KAA6134700.1 hypothetical protein F1632_06430 [Klebsiella pneumoniae subsp. pneumoniae]MBE8795982.1 hypothetical protein [Klebsiella pneumoniae]MBQ5173437.1 hypothetical protein [Klebsiella pneumoniae]